jgi:hypothetical protein
MNAITNRYEQKITYETYIEVRNYLATVAAQEEKSEGKAYRRVNILPFNGGLFSGNEQYQIKTYDYQDIFVEKLVKRNGMYQIESAPITKQECMRLLSGDTAWMRYAKDSLLRELFSHMAYYDFELEDSKNGVLEIFCYHDETTQISLERTGMRTTDYHMFLDEKYHTLSFIGGDITLSVSGEYYGLDYYGHLINQEILALSA